MMPFDRFHESVFTIHDTSGMIAGSTVPIRLKLSTFNCQQPTDTGSLVD